MPEKSWVSWVTKPMRSRKPSRSTTSRACAVVEDAAGLRPVEADEELHEGGLARTRGSDESHGLAALDPEGDLVEGGGGGGQVGEAHVFEREVGQLVEADGILGLRLPGRLQDGVEVAERHLGLAVDVDDVPELLQGPEDEERVDPEREELAHRDLAGEDQVEHQEEDAGAQRVHRASPG